MSQHHRNSTASDQTIIQNQHFKQQNINYRKFLQTFKTILCKNNYYHNFQQCQFYHSNDDRRRNPYLKYTIIYAPELCNQYNYCSQDCKKCHNLYEYEYHPLVYLQNNCNRYFNCTKKYCPYVHIREAHTLANCYFRFDINTFKTIFCNKQCSHNLKICPYYHNRLDRRRPNFIYQHVSCQLKDNCLNGDACKSAHNKIEQLYHPSRYKSKFCQKYPNNISQCQYGQFCSFAHQDSQIVINLIHNKKRDHQFFSSEYKTVWCPYTTKHQRNKCVYAHNVQDFRRNPKIYEYEAQRCSNWNMNQNLTSLQMGGCPQGMRCSKCHGWKQYQYHPLRYNMNNNIPTNNNPNKSKKQNNNSNLMNTIQNNHFQKTEIIKILETKNLKNFQQKRQSKIEPIVLDQTFLLQNMIGAPFFQSQSDSIFKNYQDISSNGKNYNLNKGKGRGTASQTDAQQINLKMNRKDSADSPTVFKRQCQPVKIFASKLFTNQQDDFFMTWKQSPQIRINAQQKKQRARSCQKQQISLLYSKELKQHFANTGILQKFQIRKINEIKLLNFGESDLQKLDYLTIDQKKIFIQRIKQFNNRSQASHTTYSSELHEFFDQNNKHYLLNKMKKKRVREQKLLNLQSNEIQALSFLEQQDKKQLPKIIQQYNNNKEYSDIASMISEQTSVQGKS